ncbi:expressed unknown protein [Seminavis robusta]|uniref:Uncharacterized protein n=1 Tax=Seminavis robusta TaxID=568900 RepID=A0A9N8DDX8_9STRA|nr:expressed unknown protein [Seminavis robusta]|eukprot:Sro74_g040680.1 n/a (421) ;mRNA; f:36394-38338
MAAYSNYQVPPQYGQPPPQPFGQPPPPQQQQYGQQQYGQQPQYDQQPQYGMQMQSNMQHGSAPRRGSIQRSMSFDPSQSPFGNQSTAVVSFDPYASATPSQGGGGGDPFAPAGSVQAPPPGQSFQSASPYASATYGNTSSSMSVASGPGGVAPYGIPPSYSNEAMTTSPQGQSHFGGDLFASAPPASTSPTTHQGFQNPNASVVSDITMFSSAPPAFAASAPPATSTALAPAPGPKVKTTSSALAKARKGEFNEGDVDPALAAEQAKILEKIQARNKMKQLRQNAGMVPYNNQSQGMVPYNGGGGTDRRAPPRTRSMPNPNSRGQQNSIAHGGKAVLDPKKDKRKQTRKMKTAAGTVGGAVIGGLVAGPVGVVLGAGGGAAISNKAAKSRDKRKQQEFEQKNFQKAASQSTAAKGDGAFA